MSQRGSVKWDLKYCEDGNTPYLQVVIGFWSAETPQGARSWLPTTQDMGRGEIVPQKRNVELGDPVAFECPDTTGDQAPQDESERQAFPE